MEEKILGAVGAVLFIAGAVMLIKMMLFRLNGQLTEGVVVSSEKDEKNWYTPLVSYMTEKGELTGRTKEKYSAPMTGQKKAIIYNKKSPEVFRIAESQTTGLIGAVSSVVLGAAFVIRFLIV